MPALAPIEAQEATATLPVLLVEHEVLVQELAEPAVAAAQVAAAAQALVLDEQVVVV